MVSIATAVTAVDVKEYPDKYVFLADMPGVRANGVRVQVEHGNILVISGERSRTDEEEKDKVIERDAKFIRIERCFGKFLRKFTLSDSCNLRAISVSCTDGVIIVSVPKLLPPESDSTQLQVMEKENSTENNRGLIINGASLIEESLSNTTSSPNNVDEENKTGKIFDIAACDPEVEIVSSADFATEAKDRKSELWPKTTLLVFIAKFEKLYASLNYGYMSQKHWDQIANETNQICKSNVSGLQCKNKWFRLKKIYKREKVKLNVTGAKTSTWPYYEDLDRIVGKSRKKSKLSGGFDGLQWLNREPDIFPKRKEREIELSDEDALDEHHNATSQRFKQTPSKDFDVEGKRVKRVKSTMGSIASAMETNMKHLTETMKEIEQNKMRQESIQLDKILQTQLQIAQLFAQK